MGSVLTEDDFYGEFQGRLSALITSGIVRRFLHKLEFIKIIYVWSGSVTLYLDNVKYELLSGNFCIITPGIRHTVFSRHDEDADHQYPNAHQFLCQCVFRDLDGTEYPG